MNDANQNDGNDQNECCVCMAAHLPTLTDPDTGELMSILEIGEDFPINLRGLTQPMFLFRSSCADHAICNACLHHLATSFGNNHPIGPKHPMLPCPYPFKECLTQTTGLPNYFPHAVVERVLTPEEQLLYQAHAQRYQFPGYELVQCPRPSRYGTICGAGILVSLESVRTTLPGELIMRCDQSQQCQRHTCYHCRSLVHRARNQCDNCLTSTENMNPKLLNHYFHRENKKAGDGQPNLYRNEELTEDIILPQLRDIVNADRLEVRCTECLTFMFKTELCNTLEHCGIERCYSCGRSGTTTKKIGDHWDSNGYKGCPRFDYSAFWNTLAGCNFRCMEGECYGSEVGDCTIAEHAVGVRNMIEMRKRAHIYHAIKSLLPEMRKHILEKVWLQQDDIRPYLPSHWSSDYRTYVPDVIEAAGGSRTVPPLLFERIPYPVRVVAAASSSFNEKKKAGQAPKKCKEYEMLFRRFKSRYIKNRPQQIAG